MIRFAVVLILGSAIAVGQKQPDKRQKTEAAVTTVPNGASELSPGVFKHTDASGKTWIYRKTPFGVVKVADVPPPTPAVEPAPEKRGNPFNNTAKATDAAPAPSATAVEHGDSYKFERSTPFGPVRWTRKKSELTADEQEIVKRSTQKNPSDGTNE